jgi:uncharacterized protein (TIGR02266 family)
MHMVYWYIKGGCIGIDPQASLSGRYGDVKVLMKKSKHYRGYCVKMNQEDESLTIENPEGEEIARLVLDDFLSRLGATARGYKRKFPRLGMGVCVKYADREGNSCEGIASTIGGGGLFVEALKPLPEGIDTRLEFMLPASQRVISAKARVVWVRRNFVQKFFYPGMGMQFVEISDGDRAELVDFVDKFNLQRGSQES